MAPPAVWAVVKADGYGHGAIDVRAAGARRGGRGLCVALVDEGVELREAGIDAPILRAQRAAARRRGRAIVEHRLTPTVYTRRLHRRVGRARRRPADGSTSISRSTPACAASGPLPATRSDCVESIAGTTAAAAGRRVHPSRRRRRAGRPVRPPLSWRRSTTCSPTLAGDPVAVHAANSAGALGPSRGAVLVRSSGDRDLRDLARATASTISAASCVRRCALQARVSYVKRVEAGSRISYGLRHTFATATHRRHHPDRVRRRRPRRCSTTGGEVLIGGRRRPIVGIVTMDQLMVDCRRRSGAVGDEVVLIGEQGRRADHAPRSGPTGWARSATRSCVASAGASPAVHARRNIGG